MSDSIELYELIERLGDENAELRKFVKSVVDVEMVPDEFRASTLYHLIGKAKQLLNK